MFDEVDMDAPDTAELLPLHLNNTYYNNNKTGKKDTSSNNVTTTDSSIHHHHHQSYYIAMQLATVMEKTKHCGKHFE